MAKDFWITVFCVFVSIGVVVGTIMLLRATTPKEGDNWESCKTNLSCNSGKCVVLGDKNKCIPNDSTIYQVNDAGILERFTVVPVR